MPAPKGRLVPLVAAACVGVLAGALLAVAAAPPGPVRVRTASVARDAGPAHVEGEWPATTTTAPGRPTAFPVADAVVASVPLFDAPDVPSGSALENPTWEGLHVTFLVLEDRGDWLRVRVSARPNGRTAWVRAADVSRRTVPNWILVELGARRLTVLHGEEPLLTTTVGVGRPSTPTPTGSFFVDGLVVLDPPHPAYGAGQVSVSGFSEVHESFAGGVGQIALHGTAAPGLLGQETSNGCVRVDDESIRRVIELAPRGTPVEIVP